MLLGVYKSVREWTFTLPNELPLWELESRWTFKFLENNFKGQNPLDWRVFYIIGKILVTGPALKCHFISPLWRRITLCENLQLRWGLKQSYSPHWELSNDMLHITWTQGNWGDSQLLVVGSQIANLIPDPSFGHNLCFKCPNGVFMDKNLTFSTMLLTKLWKWFF